MSEEAGVSTVVDAAYQFSKWKIITLIVGGLLVAGGVATEAATDSADPTHTVELDDVSRPGQAFTEGDSSTPSALPSKVSDEAVAEKELKEDVSPAMVRGGFGLILGFCIGFAARVFLRMAAIVVGTAFLVVFMFGYLGWVEIKWDVMSDQANTILSSLGDQFASFRAFVTGHIPSTGMAGVGLLVGWRKK